ncbi:MAG TPA: hypothetical protein VFM55_17150 [Micromonosporaceae bacterium]|nr:hypothetical protein [Micromonosporaceae bacterium]
MIMEFAGDHMISERAILGQPTLTAANPDGEVVVDWWVPSTPTCES